MICISRVKQLAGDQGDFISFYTAIIKEAILAHVSEKGVTVRENPLCLGRERQRDWDSHRWCQDLVSLLFPIKYSVSKVLRWTGIGS